MVYLLVILLVIIALIWIVSKFFYAVKLILKTVFCTIPKRLYEIWSKPQ